MAWLKEHNEVVEYHDILKEPLGKEELAELAALGNTSIRGLVNPKSTAFKALNLDLATISEDDAATIINQHPKTMIRPLLTDGKKIAIGFNEDDFAGIVNQG